MTVLDDKEIIDFILNKGNEQEDDKKKVYRKPRFT